MSRILACVAVCSVLTLPFNSVFGQTTDFNQLKATFYNNAPSNLTTTEDEEGTPLAKFKKVEHFLGPRLFSDGQLSVMADEYAAFEIESNGPPMVVSELGPFTAPSIGQDVNPSNLPQYYSANGTGRMSCITIDPNDPSHQTLYAGSMAGGVWKSTDRGANWQMLNTDVQLPLLGVSDIAVSPNNANHILVATGFRDDYHFTTLNAGMFRSTDGGITWQAASSGLFSFTTDQISKILIDPSNPNVVYLATSRGIYRSINAWATNPTAVVWTKIFPLFGTEYFRNILFAPGQSSSYPKLLASGKNIYSSMDAGENWDVLTGTGTGLDFSTLTYTHPIRINIATTPADPAVIFAYMIVSNTVPPLVWNSPRHCYVFRYDGGQWTELFNSSSAGETLDNFNESWLAIVATPIDANVCFFGNTIIRRVEFGGSIESIFEYGNTKMHVDVHDMLSDGTSILVANDGGVAEILNTTAADVQDFLYNNVSYGLATGTITHVSSGIRKIEIYTIGRFDCGSSVLDGANGLSWRMVKGGDGFENSINPMNENFIAVNTQGNDGKFSNDRFSVTEISNSSVGVLEYPFNGECVGIADNNREIANFDMPYLADPSKPTRYYLGFTDVFEVEFNNDFTSPSGFVTPTTRLSYFHNDFQYALCSNPITRIFVPDADPNTIYVAKENRLFKTTTRGYNSTCSSGCWSEIASPLADQYITAMEFDPLNADRMWIAFSGYSEGSRVFTSTNGGTSWQNISDGLPNFPVNDLLYENQVGNAMYAATDVGLYYRNNDYSEWVRISSSLPNTVISDLEVNYERKELVIATYGRGLWKGKLICPETETASISGDLHSSAFAYADDLLTSSQIIIDDELHVHYRSNRKIVLSEGFKAKAGGSSIFKASITSCDNSAFSGRYGEEPSPSRIKSDRNMLFGAKSSSATALHPNPTTGRITYNGTAPLASATVMDLTGRTLHTVSLSSGLPRIEGQSGPSIRPGASIWPENGPTQHDQPTQGDNSYTFDLSPYRPGTYLLRIQYQSGKVEVHRIIRQ